MEDQTNQQTDQEGFLDTGTRYKVKVIGDKCISAASCIAVAMRTFQLDQKGIAEVKADAGGDSEDDVLLAAQSCPTAAIEVIDTVTGEKVWPK